MEKYKVHIVWFLVAVVALVGGIYYGKTSSTVATTSGTTGSTTRGNFAGRTGAGGGAGGGFATGQIVSKDSQSFTLQLANGNSEIVFYSSSTSVIKPTQASVNDLTTGTTVMVGGTQNADGSVTAQTVQVRNTTPPSGQAGQ